MDFAQEDVNQLVQLHIRNQEVTTEDNPLDKMSDPDGTVQNLFFSSHFFDNIAFSRIILLRWNRRPSLQGASTV